MDQRTLFGYVTKPSFQVIRTSQTYEKLNTMKIKLPQVSKEGLKLWRFFERYFHRADIFVTANPTVTKHYRHTCLFIYNNYVFLNEYI